MSFKGDSTYSERGERGVKRDKCLTQRTRRSEEREQ